MKYNVKSAMLQKMQWIKLHYYNQTYLCPKLKVYKENVRKMWAYCCSMYYIC